jgi:hypothetical protein
MTEPFKDALCTFGGFVIPLSEVPDKSLQEHLDNLPMGHYPVLRERAKVTLEDELKRRGIEPGLLSYRLDDDLPRRTFLRSWDTEKVSPHVGTNEL